MDSVNSSPLWQPQESAISAANITHFANYIRKTHDRNLGGQFRDLHAFSVQNPGLFWRSIWERCGVSAKPGARDFVSDPCVFRWRWFPDSRLNYAEELLKPNRLQDAAFANSLAIASYHESGTQRQINRQELYDAVVALARFFQSRGIVAGDRIVAVIPNCSEAVIAYLATTAIGAVWSSCSPEFGEDAICDRFGQIEPKLMITSIETSYQGKRIRPIDKVDHVLPRLSSLKTLVIIGGQEDTSTSTNTQSMERWSWQAAIDAARVSKETFQAFAFERFPFDHPLCVVYSSGTTGVPKCIVHGIGGTLLQHLKEHQLHCDLKPGDQMFYYTTTGWMMWNWLVSGLASEASIVTFDGSPVFPEPEYLWRCADELEITHFGASARYFANLQKSSCVPKEVARLETLRCVMSTGSPLLPETFDWMYHSIRTDMNLASISGGTDILSCFVLGNPTLSVYSGEIQCSGLGMDVRIFDPHGKPLLDSPGELVCTNAFPSMPGRFWNDPDGSKYRAAYFERFDNVWCHGDWARETERGGFIIYGRSDATLNPSGVRIGTAEIYQQLETFPEIAECLATVLRADGDEQIVLFVRIAAGHLFSDSLAAGIRKRLRERCSPRHVPAYLAAAPDLPRTVSGKLSEIAVRSAISGQDLGNCGALANPECMEFFRSWKPQRT